MIDGPVHICYCPTWYEARYARVPTAAIRLKVDSSGLASRASSSPPLRRRAAQPLALLDPLPRRTGPQSPRPQTPWLGRDDGAPGFRSDGRVFAAMRRRLPGLRGSRRRLSRGQAGARARPWRQRGHGPLPPRPGSASGGLRRCLRSAHRRRPQRGALPCAARFLHPRERALAERGLRFVGDHRVELDPDHLCLYPHTRIEAAERRSDRRAVRPRRVARRPRARRRRRGAPGAPWWISSTHPAPCGTRSICAITAYFASVHPLHFLTL